MALSECENGHIYDKDQYTSCPYCKNKEVRIEFGTSEKTIGKTVPVSMGSNIGKTVPVSDNNGINKSSSKVYGWLVSIDGKDCGEDYKITSINCLIGTGPEADIVLSVSSSDYSGNIFRICFDKRGGQFYIVPDQGYTDIYVDDEPVFTQRPIPTRTCIEVGGSKYIFIAFCNDSFNWN